MKKNGKHIAICTLFLIAGVLFSCAKKDTSTKGITVKEVMSSMEEVETQSQEDDFDYSQMFGAASSYTEEEEVEEDPKMVFVYITGAVNIPDVYILEDGARIIDAVEAAQGFTEYAAKDYINLAERIVDGQRVYVPKMLDIKMAETGEGLTPYTFFDNTGVDTMTRTPKTTKVNINTAFATDLMTLDGIGQAKALAIIKYREKNGEFSKIEDIKNVSGIGEGSYEKIKDEITIE